MTDDQPASAEAAQLGALEPVPWGIPSLIVALLLAIGLFASAITSVAILAHVLGIHRRSASWDAAGLVFTSLFDLCLLGVTLALSLPRRGMSLSKYGFRGFRSGELYIPAVGVVGMYLILALYVGAVSLLHLPMFRPVPNLPEHLLQARNLIPPTVIAACLIAPVVEESFFRGFVFRGLLRQTYRLGIPGHGPQLRIGFWTAAFASGLLFAAVHGEIGLLVPFTLVGVLLAWIFWRTGSLWPGILAHAGFNAINLALALVTQH